MRQVCNLVPGFRIPYDELFRHRPTAGVKGRVKPGQWGRAKLGHLAVAHGGCGAALVSLLASGGWFSLTLALLEPVAVTIHFQGVDMVGEAVEQRTGELFLQTQQLLFIAGFDQFADQRSRCSEAHTVTTLAGSQAESSAMCVFPVPEFPRTSRFSRRLRNSDRARSSTIFSFRDGMARKSKLSRLLTTGNLACRMRRSVARRSRSSDSSSVMRSS
jgi:hypothetical protein